jgi:DNA-binding Xre family transcriptional regulator
MGITHRLSELIPEGVTPYAVAKKANISTNTMYRLTNDPTAAMSWEVMGKLCAALECQPGDLLRWEPELS